MICVNTVSRSNGGTSLFRRGASEQKLDWSTAKLDVILRQSAEAIILCDGEGRVLEVSRLARRLCEEDAAGQPFVKLYPLAVLAPGKKNARGAPYTPVFGSLGQPVHGLKVRLRRKKGRGLNFRLDMIPVPRGASGSGWVVILAGRWRDLATPKKPTAHAQPSKAQLRALALRLQKLRETERAAIAREIHDVLAQDLTRFKMDLAWLGKQLETAAARERLAAMNQLIDGTISAVRGIVTRLRPEVLDSLGLCAALEWQTREFQARTGIPCELSLPEPEICVESERSIALFRILQESLTNVARHARATRVKICLESGADGLVLSVEDDGQGMDSRKFQDPRAAGLLGMRERALLLRGRCEIVSRPGQGTRVVASLPAA